MKKIVLSLMVLFIAQSTFSQKIILHRNAGGDQTYQLSSVDSISFQPFVCGDDIRYEGKTYGTVSIGTQCWMKKNLDVGTMILGAIDQTNNSILEKYCYNNDTANCTIYGGLYQWYETMQYVASPGAKGICPEGWHIPTYDEFVVLQNYVGINNADALKEIGQGTGNNSSGFSGLMAGARYLTAEFGQLTQSAFFYSSNGNSSSCRYLYIYAADPTIRSTVNTPTTGLSVRCLKN